MDRSGKPYISTPWAKISSPNLVDRSSTHWIRFNKIDVFKIWFILNAFIGIFVGSSIMCARTVH